MSGCAFCSMTPTGWGGGVPFGRERSVLVRFAKESLRWVSDLWFMLLS